jgi:Uma2 family endonuclease
MAVALPKRLSADEFIAWATTQEGRFELEAGEVVAMAPERAAHARTKARAHRRLEDAIAAAGLACEAFPDGMSLRIDAATVYEPDASVCCGPRLPGDATELENPRIVVEVLSPSSRGIDSGAKLEGYFRLPGLCHYLILMPDSGVVIHHHRDATGRILTVVRHDGELRLDPPGIVITVASLFDAASPPPAP